MIYAPIASLLRARAQRDKRHGFTLMELLVVVSIIAILAALLLPVLNKAKASSQRTLCLNNVKQITLGVRMYSDDSSDKAPLPGDVITNHSSIRSGYKKLIQSYVGVQGTSPPQARLFSCPADTFFYVFTNSFYFD